ncbi:DUF192 domain-containing protein [Gudongella sp. DL1XJH-153]|uniref:DUF192 domain-containing protein n=1 Tax=Gudongella sp. DL1XJH-153 TaxID=3409804 RepID=UPI003BB60608
MVSRMTVRDKVVLDKIIMADTYTKRLQGLLGRKGLDEKEGMMIVPCNSIHTFRMKFSIDVLFVDKNNIVRKVLRNFKPGRMGPLVLKSHFVMEAEAGVFDDVDEGDKLEFN